MFENLSQRLMKTVRHISGRGRLTEANIKSAIREIRMALLEGDVALSVVTEFIDEIKTKAIGEEVLKSLRPDQVLVKIVHHELVKILGAEDSSLEFDATPPVVMLLAGLQGSGKTTTTAKLAKFIKEQHNKKILMVSVDVYRPAAIEQLATLAESLDIDCFPSKPSDKPADIVKKAIDQAKKQAVDVVLIDSAGRLHIDDEMMAEIKLIHQLAKPTETLFVVDSMTGQDAANTAKVFADALPLTGIILTKVDGDARGGAALSMRKITGQAIKFIGVGEKIANFETFSAEKIAAKILDKQTIVEWVEEIQAKVDQTKAKKIAKKIKKGRGFNLQDFLGQIEQMQKIGGMGKLLNSIPGISKLPKALKSQMNDKKLVGMKALIQSMTREERMHPAIIKGSRKSRITKGAGRPPPELNQLLKQFLQMQKMVKKMAKAGGMAKMMRQIQGLGGMQGPGGMAGVDLQNMLTDDDDKK